MTSSVQIFDLLLLFQNPPLYPLSTYSGTTMTVWSTTTLSGGSKLQPRQRASSLLPMQTRGTKGTTLVLPVILPLQLSSSLSPEVSDCSQQLSKFLKFTNEDGLVNILYPRYRADTIRNHFSQNASNIVFFYSSF